MMVDGTGTTLMEPRTVGTWRKGTAARAALLVHQQYQTSGFEQAQRDVVASCGEVMTREALAKIVARTPDSRLGRLMPGWPSGLSATVSRSGAGLSPRRARAESLGRGWVAVTGRPWSCVVLGASLGDKQIGDSTEGRIREHVEH